MNIMTMPFGRISTTLGTSWKYMSQAGAGHVGGTLGKMVMGAGLGAGAAYATDNNMALGALGGAAGGLAMGKGYHNYINAETSLSSGYNSIKGAVASDWKTAGMSWANR